MMTAIIIEDEPLAVAELESILREIAPDIRVVARLTSVEESVGWLSGNKVQLIFSDIHLGDGRSFDIFARVKTDAPVIFITAYDEYAIEAFKNQGIEYVLKPFDPEDIRVAVEKVRRFWPEMEETAEEVIPGMPKAAVAGETETYQKRFLVQIGAKIRSVPVEDIAYFMADGKYSMLYTTDGQNYIVDHTMGGIETRLDPRRFFRINRKFLVSFGAIREMVRYSSSRIRVVLAPPPPENTESIVSAERIRDFREWLNQ